VRPTVCERLVGAEGSVLATCDPSDRAIEW
jgi:hypothetical protein